MKEYIKPQAELIEYSFDDIIAGSREVEGDVPDIDIDLTNDNFFS